MDPVTPITPAHLAYWSDELSAEAVTFGPPTDDALDCSPCAAVITVTATLDGEGAEHVVRTPWRPSPDDLEQLAAGGTIWLSTWGGLPPHQLEVQPPTPTGPPEVVVAPCPRCPHPLADHLDGTCSGYLGAGLNFRPCGCGTTTPDTDPGCTFDCRGDHHTPGCTTTAPRP